MIVHAANRASEYLPSYSVKPQLCFKGQQEVDQYRKQFENYSDNTLKTLLSIREVAQSPTLGWLRHIFWAGWYGYKDPNVKEVNQQIWELRKHRKDNEQGLQNFNEYLDVIDEDLVRRNILKQKDIKPKSNFFKKYYSDANKIDMHIL